MGEFTIELRNLEFYSFHGLYDEEKKVGGEFVVDAFAKFPAEDHILASIKETVNYAALFAIIKEEMAQPRELLETIAQSTAEKVSLNLLRSLIILPSIKILTCLRKLPLSSST